MRNEEPDPLVEPLYRPLTTPLHEPLHRSRPLGGARLLRQATIRGRLVQVFSNGRMCVSGQATGKTFELFEILRAALGQPSIDDDFFALADEVVRERETLQLEVVQDDLARAVEAVGRWSEAVQRALLERPPWFHPQQRADLLAALPRVSLPADPWSAESRAARRTAGAGGRYAPGVRKARKRERKARKAARKARQR